jgi:5-methyltetrahydrofolate--homocysteine methyltransferase
MDTKFQSLYTAILEGDKDAVEENVRAAIDGGVNPSLLLDKVMIPAMSEVGRRFEAGEYFVPEMLIAARSMQGGLSLLRPLLIKQGVKPVARAVIGTVKGDLHDIGKNLVSIMLEGAGFEIHDLGVDVPPEKFVQAAQEHQPDVVGLSAMLTTTMSAMKMVIESLQAAGLRDKVKIVVGGAPLTESFAQQIGADGFAPDANRAVTLTLSLITPKKSL